jgi:hypothetical protein
MQTANVGHSHHFAFAWRLDRPWHRRIALQRQVGTNGMVIVQIRHDESPQMGFIEHDDTVEKLSAEGSNHSLYIGILPRTTGGNEYLFDAHVGDTLSEIVAIDAVPIAQKIPWTLVEWKGFDDLLYGPLGRRVLGGIEVDHLTLFSMKSI